MTYFYVLPAPVLISIEVRNKFPDKTIITFKALNAKLARILIEADKSC